MHKDRLLRVPPSFVATVFRSRDRTLRHPTDFSDLIEGYRVYSPSFGYRKTALDVLGRVFMTMKTFRDPKRVEAKLIIICRLLLVKYHTIFI